VAVELAEVNVNKRRVQEGRESLGQIHRQAATARVEIIQVVFKADSLRPDALWVIDAGNDSPTLFL